MELELSLDITGELTKEQKRELGLIEPKISPPAWLLSPQEYGLKGIVLNNDIDGVQSGLIVSHYTGLPIVAMFDYKHLWYSEEHERYDLHELLFIDSDINKDGIYSVGNHVTMLNRYDKVNPLNYNLNNKYRIARNHNYYEHYAGSTALMVASAFNHLPSSIDGQRLLMFADGTFKIPMNFRDRYNRPNDKIIIKWLERLDFHEELSSLLVYSEDSREYFKYIHLLRSIRYDKSEFNISQEGVFLLQKEKVDTICGLLGVAAHVPTFYKTIKTFNSNYINLSDNINSLDGIIDKCPSGEFFAKTFAGKSRMYVCF